VRLSRIHAVRQGDLNAKAQGCKDFGELSRAANFAILILQILFILSKSPFWLRLCVFAFNFHCMVTPQDILTDWRGLAIECGEDCGRL
jgi:hypothetical protein